MCVCVCVCVYLCVCVSVYMSVSVFISVSLFGVDINPVHVHIASQNYCRPTYSDIEMTRIACRLPWKDLCKTQPETFY